jgi:iron-sulfur cluster assembly accessory protein
MTHILEKSNEYAFVFFATGGGCNGFNYKLESIDEKKFDNLTAEEPSPIIVTNSNTQVIIEPMSEMLLLGTTIDFIEEDYNENIFESRFIFTPEKDFATSCGCGISFSPK